MRYVVTGKRGRELQARAVLSAAEGMAEVDRMEAEGFAIVSVVDRSYRPIDVCELKAAAEEERKHVVAV